jgi:excisionase family DNA binding protein
MPTSEFMNVRETAMHLGVHENTVRNWERCGMLRGFKLPGSGYRRFPREEVERMRAEMLSSYAPATELPEETRTGVSGTIIDGDLLP